MAYLAAFLLLVSSPVFALPDAVMSALGEMALNVATVASFVLAAQVGIAAIKMLYLNFVPQEQISEFDSLLDFKALPESGTDWAKMRTHLDFHVEPPGSDGLLPDIDPARLTDYDEIDFIVLNDLAELDSMNKE